MWKIWLLGETAYQNPFNDLKNQVQCDPTIVLIFHYFPCPSLCSCPLITLFNIANHLLT